jgi:1-acyl-sn-glycerol-3-phosphate acyltransferase
MDALVAPDDAAARAAIAETVCPRPTLLRDVLRLGLEQMLDTVVRDGPAPAGPPVYLANHQTGFDLLVLAAVLAGVAGERSRVLVWDGMRQMHYGEMLLPLVERPDDQDGMAHRVDLVHADTRVPERTRAAVTTLTDRRDTRAIIAAAEGSLQLTDGQPTPRVSTALLDLAAALDRPIVPVRVCWGLPTHSDGGRHGWPYLFAPLGLFLGTPLTPDDLAPLPLPERRLRVGTAIDALHRPRPAGHADRGAAMTHRVRTIIAATGVSQTKAVLQDLLLAADPATLTAEGRAVREFLHHGRRSPLARRDDWLARYALALSDGMATTGLPLDRLYR